MTRAVEHGRRVVGGGRDAILTIVLFVAALALRLLAQRPDALWLDEANSILIALRSPSGIVEALRQDGNPPLYYLLLHAWMTLFGSGEGAARAFSLLTGSFLPPALFLAGRRFGVAAGVTAGILALAWPLHVHYSRQVRMYAFVPVLATAFMAALYRAMDTGRVAMPDLRRQLAAWSLVGVLALALIWTHHYGMFLVVAAPFAWLLAGPRTMAVGLRLGATLLAVAVVDLLWLPTVLAQAGSGVGDWIGASFRPDAVVRSLLLFGAGYHVPPTVQGLASRSPQAPFAVVWVLTVGLGCVFLTLRDPSVNARARALLAVLLVTMGVPWTVSILGRPIYYVGRYEIVAYPAFALLIGAGVAALRRRTSHPLFFIVTGGVLLIYLVLAGLALARHVGRPPDRTTEQIAERLASWTRPGDLVITTGLGRAPIEYYLRRVDEDQVPIESFPGFQAAHLGWFDLQAVRRTPGVIEEQAREMVERLRQCRGNVFLVDNTHLPEIEAVNQLLRTRLEDTAAARRVLLRAGPDPRGRPLFEVVAYRFRAEGPAP